MTILVIQGCTGTPNGYLEVQISTLLVLCMIWEPSWDPLLRNFRDFSEIWAAKVGDSFQTKFLMILGWKYCLNAVVVCARNTIKTIVFSGVSFSPNSRIL